MIKVEILSVYGSGAMGYKYWSYDATVMVKGSIKSAIDYARKIMWEHAIDKEGFNWIPVIDNVKVYDGNKLIMESN